MIEKIKKLSGFTKFLLGMIILYAIIGLFNQSYIISVFTDLWKSLVDITPILIFVFFLLFLINLFINPERIERQLGHNSGFRGWIYASLGSIFISGPPYVLLPILGELKKRGMKESLIAVFMNNRNVQLPYLPVMIFYFGFPFTVVISIYILIFAVINAAILGKIMEK
jgi:uncharacterized membrane protein YraQ (UPF0718 family)